MRQWIAFPLLLVATHTWAAEAVLSGQGKVLSAPDYVELNIQVQSLCYSSPDEARKVNDESARKIVSFLNTKVKGEGYYNKVITLGGYTQPYQSYQQNRIVCEGTFQKQNSITLRTQAVDDYEALYDEVQKEVYKNFSIQPRGVVESSTTFVTMSTPVPSVSEEKRRELEQQAMTMAFVDAKAKLQAIFTDKTITNLKVVEVNELPIQSAPPPQIYQKSQMRSMSLAAEAGGGAAPVQFDDQWIYKTVYFRFSFDDLAF